MRKEQTDCGAQPEPPSEYFSATGNKWPGTQQEQSLSARSPGANSQVLWNSNVIYVHFTLI